MQQLVYAKVACDHPLRLRLYKETTTRLLRWGVYQPLARWSWKLSVEADVPSNWTSIYNC